MTGPKNSTKVWGGPTLHKKPRGAPRGNIKGKIFIYRKRVTSPLYVLIVLSGNSSTII